MKRMIHMHANLSKAIAQRLALYYKVGDAFPALTASLTPKNLEMDTTMNDIIGPRQISSSYISVYKTIMPQGEGGSVNFEKHLAQIEDIQETMLGITLIKTKAGLDAEGNDPKSSKQAPIGLSKAMQKLIEDMWAKTDIVSLILMARRTADDVKDEFNMVALNQLEKQEDIKKVLNMEAFFKGMFQSMRIGDGTLDKSYETWVSTMDDYLNTTEVLIAQEGNFCSSFGFTEMVDLISPASSNKRKTDAQGKAFAQKLISHLTTLDGLKQVEHVVGHFAPAPITREFHAINRDVNQLILEMAQVEDLLALRIYNSLQAWVALTQRTMIPFQRPEALDYVKHLFSNFANTYDIDGIMNEFLSLPIGPMSNAIINANEDVTAVTVRGSQLTSIVTPYASNEPANGLDTFAGTIKQIVLSLYPLLKNKELWALYQRGALLAGAKAPTYKRVTRSLDAMPTVFCSFGSYAGNRLSTLDDINWTLLFDWGINKFNSSSLTDVTWNEAKDDELILSLSHGQIDYQQYKRDYLATLFGFSKNGVSGYAFSQHNIPLVAYRRSTLKSATPFLGVDMSIIKLGATCLLPVAPQNTHPVISDARPKYVDKMLIGAYETELESLPMNFSHTAHLTGDAIRIHDSIIPQFLRISEKNFDRSIKGTTLLKRFTNKVTPTALNCSTISEDPFFMNMVSHFFVSPANWVEPKMHELYLRPFMTLEEGEDSLGAVMAKEIGVHTFIQGNIGSGRGVVGPRILTTCTSLDRTDPLPKNSFMGYINPEHGTIEG